MTIITKSFVFFFTSLVASRLRARSLFFVYTHTAGCMTKYGLKGPVWIANPKPFPPLPPLKLSQDPQKRPRGTPNYFSPFLCYLTSNIILYKPD